MVPVLALVLTVSSVAFAAASPQDLQKKARARMKSLDFEAALPLLEQLRDLPGLDAPTRAQALVDLGITFVNLGRAEDARKAFDDALEANPAVPFPPGAAPKIRRLFDDAKDAREARLKPPPVADAKPEPKLQAKPEPVPVVALPPPPPPAPKPRMKLVPGLLVGAGVLGVGAGVSTAFASQNADRKLHGSLHTSAEAARLLSNRQTYGLASYVCYGAGAALIATGAALFLFSGGPAEISAGLTPSGAAVSVRGAW